MNIYAWNHFYLAKRYVKIKQIYSNSYGKKSSLKEIMPI